MDGPNRSHPGLWVWRALLLGSMAVLLAACAGEAPPPEQEAVVPPPSENGIAVTTLGEGTQTVVLLGFADNPPLEQVALGGDMEPESDGGVWTETPFWDPTLAVSPRTLWSPGLRSLAVTVASPDGGEFTTILFFSF